MNTCFVFCQVCSNSVQQLQRRSRKYLSQSEVIAVILVLRWAQQKQHTCSSTVQRSRKYLDRSKAVTAISVFPIGQKKSTNVIEDIEYLLPVKCHQIPFSDFREVKKYINAQAKQRSRWQSWFYDRLKNTNLVHVEDIETLAPSSVVKFLSMVADKKSTMSQQIRGRVGNLGFIIDPKNTQFQFNGCTCFLSSVVEIRSAVAEEKPKISMNQRPGWPSWFSDRSKNTTPGKDVDILPPSSFVEFLSVVAEKKSAMSRCEKDQICRG